MKEIYTSCYSIKTRNSYSFFSYGQPAMPWKPFSNITFLDIKTKYRSPYLLDVFYLTYRTTEGRL